LQSIAKHLQDIAKQKIEREQEKSIGIYGCQALQSFVLLCVKCAKLH
jgi:hypothetical protein